MHDDDVPPLLQADPALFERSNMWLKDEMRYPGHGLPERVQNLASSMPGWSRLARNAPLGQKINFLYDGHKTTAQVSSDQALQLPGDGGSDLDACQIQLVLSPPLAIPRSAAELEGLNSQTQSGELDNAAMGTFGDYPGLGTSIVWPPFIYVVEWGIGGTRVRAEVDAVNGANVNLTASFVRVYAAVAADGASNAQGTSGIYTLAAFVGPGWPKSGSAQRTVFVGTIDAPVDSVLQTSPAYAVPPFAKDVTVIGNSAEMLTTAYVNFYQDPARTKCVATYFINGNQPLPFRVPNGGAYFDIANAASIANFAAVFGLSI
jgi:hypothetical protein